LAYNWECDELFAYSSIGLGAGGTATFNNGETSSANYGGLYAGFGYTLGLIFGDSDAVTGRTQNLYIQPAPNMPGPVLYFDEQNKLVGFGLTFGQAIGAGLTQTNTRTFRLH